MDKVIEHILRSIENNKTRIVDTQGKIDELKALIEEHEYVISITLSNIEQQELAIKILEKENAKRKNKKA